MRAPDAGRGEAAGHLAALILFCVATLVVFAALLPDLHTSVGTQWGDPVFNLYVLEWGSEQISRGLDNFWNAPFYHPTPHALAMSDHLLGPAAAFHVLRALGASPAAAYNLLVLATFALSGWAAWWVLRRSGVSWTGALVGGWAFTFSAFRWGALGHYQTIRMQWIPLTVWSFDRVLERPTPARAVAFVAFYALHVSGGAYLAQLVHLVLLVLLVNRWLAEPARFREVRSWVVWVPTAALALAVVFFFYSGYLAPESTLTVGQRPDELRRSSPSLLAFVPPPVAGLLTGPEKGKTLFPGYGVVLLALAGLVWGWRRFAAPRRKTTRPVVAAAAAAAAGGISILAGLHLADRFTRSGESLFPTLTGQGNAGYLPALLVVLTGTGVLAWGVRALRGGRALEWSEMPVWPRGLVISGAVMLPLCLPAFFWAASTVMPGMGGMRIPTRAFAFVALPLAYLAGVGWDRLWSGRRLPGRRLVPVALVALLAIESLGGRPTGERAPLLDEADFPRYAHWIAEHPEVTAYLELPRGRWPASETVPMYLQTLHWRPLANGYSARHPPSYKKLIRMCQPFPSLEGLQTLEGWGITHLVVHWRALPWHPGPRVRRRVPRARPAFEIHLKQHGARPVFVDGDTVIFDIRPAAEAP